MDKAFRRKSQGIIARSGESAGLQTVRLFPDRITEQWREGGYVIDFKAGPSLGEPQPVTG